MLLIDEDWSKADPVALKAAGYGAIIGYVSEDTTGKNLTRSDVDAAHSAGLAVGLVYEYATNAALGGAARGARDAGIAVAHARGDLAAPAGVCLYSAVDWNATPAQMPAILAYANAFQAVCAAAGYRAGIYGSIAVCAYLRAHGYTGLLWQTYAWSNGQWFAGAVLRQELNHINVAGATVDKDESMAQDWGQWEVTEMSILDSDAVAHDLVFGVKDILDGTNPTERGDKAPNVLHGRLAAILSQAQSNGSTGSSILSKLDGLAAPAAVDPVALAAALTSAQLAEIGTAMGAELARRLAG